VVKGRSLFDVEGKGDRVVCVLRGDHYIFVKFDDFAIAKDAKFTKAA
jgi:hypothetical protein